MAAESEAAAPGVQAASSAAPACVIGHIAVRDQATWIEYRDQVAATLAPFGGEVLFRGRKARVLGGAHEAELTVVIRFPSLDAAHSWFDSPAYQRLIPLRMAAADVELVSFAG